MRMLGPEQFGLLGLVTVFTGFLAAFNDFGLSSALIQKKDIDEVDKSTIFWVSMVLGLVLAIIFIILSPYLAVFYDEPKITAIGRVLGFLFILQAIGSTHNALLRKSLFFKRIFWVNTSAVLVGGVVALIVAYKGYGVWALVIQQIIAGGMTAIILWIVSPFRPKLIFSQTRLKLHLRFGLPLVGTQSVNYWARNADNLLIGRFLGTGALGIYSRAYSIMMLPVSRITGVISSVMFPSFSLIQEDIKRVKQIYLKISRVISFVTFPLMGALIVVAEPFVLVVLGSQWKEMVFPLQILSVIGALQSIISLNGNIFMSQGRNKLAFKITMVSSLIVVCGFIIGVQYGLQELVLVYLFVTLVTMIPVWFLLGKIINCSIKEILDNVSVQFLFAGGLVTILLYVKSWVVFPDFAHLVTWSALFCVSWLFGIRMLNRKLYNEFLQLLLELKGSKAKQKRPATFV